MAHDGVNWRKEYAEAIAEIKATLDAGEYTAEDWLIALQ